MRSWLKRIRAAIGVGLTWAVGWGLSGGLMWLIMTAAEYGFDVALFLGRQYAVVGFLGGVTFSALLRLTEGRRRFDELRIPRFAAWGALGGFLIGAGYWGLTSVLFGAFDTEGVGQFVAITTLFGAGSAAGSLSIARLADDRQLLEEGAQTADVGLSRDEKRKLLGDPEVTTS